MVDLTIRHMTTEEFCSFMRRPIPTTNKIGVEAVTVIWLSLKLGDIKLFFHPVKEMKKITNFKCDV